MKVLIVGGGSVGRFIAQQLAESNHHVTLIDSDPAVVTAYQRSSVAFAWHLGDGCDLGTLAAAGAVDADVVAAVTGDDEDNLVVSLLAKQEYAVPRVVARVNNPNNEWLFNGTWGVDVAVSTPHLITGLVQEAVTVGSFVRLLAFGDGKAKLAEVTLAATSPAADRELATLPLPRDATIVAVLRHERVIVPHGDTILRVGDEVMVLVAGDSETEVRAVLIGDGTQPKHAQSATSV
jgi:trk system potassium uptake protein TrkA